MSKLKIDWKNVGLSLLCGALAAVLLLFGFFGATDQRLRDYLYHSRKPQVDIVIVAIDDASLQSVGKWPWDRVTLSRLVSALAPAKIVGLDIDLSQASLDQTADDALAQALTVAHNVILPVDISYLPDGHTVASAILPLPKFSDAAAALAHDSLVADYDGAVRRAPLTVESSDGTTYHALGEVLARRTGARSDIVPTDSLSRFIINYAGVPGTFRVVSASSILSGQTPPEYFKNQVVIVGPTASALQDQHKVPVSSGKLMSGVEIQANIVDSFLSNDYLASLPSGWGALICLLLAIIIGVTIPRVRVRTGLVVIGSLLAVFAVTASFAAWRGSLWPFAAPLLTIAVTYPAIMVNRYIKANNERRALRHAFGKYVSPSVIESVMAHPENLVLGGERRRMTVLFSDLRGFTTLSEKMDAGSLIVLLNGYLNAMTDIVFAEHGVLDKYMGDAVMAFWGAPIDDKHHAERTVRTAILMRDRIAELNRAEYFGAGVALNAGIGISTGEMVVGNVGSHQHFDYTVVGDTVNLGSRVEGLTKQYGVQILATEETAKGLPKDYVLRRLDRVAVKGKSDPIRLYEVVGFAQNTPPEVIDKLERFARAIALYEADDFHGASYAFADILALYPNDGPSLRFWERSKDFMDSPPPAGWDGIWVMHSK